MDDLQVVELFKADKNFQKKAQEINKNYVVQLQVAKFTDLQTIASKGVLINAGTPKNQNLFYIFGLKQPSSKDEFNQFLQYFIVQIEQIINKYYLIYIDLFIFSGFTLVYFNTGLMTYSNISKFLEFYKMLPVKYYSKLKTFYIVHGNVMLKSWLWFQKSVQNQVLKKKFELISHLSELNFIEKSQYDLIPIYVKDSDNTHLHLAFQKNQVEEQKEIGSKVLGLHPHEYELTSFGIPVYLDVLVSVFNNNPTYFFAEGIFRKNASVSKEEQIEQYLSNKYSLDISINILRNYADVENFKDPYAIAGMIKKICDKMPVPLIPYSAYPILLEQIKNKEQREHVAFLKDFVKNQLPELNQRLFSFMISFLRRISEMKEVNKMTEYNLAVVFGPTFVRPQKYSMDHLKDAQHVVKSVQLFIENQENVSEYLFILYAKIFPNENYEQYLVHSTFNRSASVFIMQPDVGQQNQRFRQTLDLSSKR